jgi:hypothetical protein
MELESLNDFDWVDGMSAVGGQVGQQVDEIGCIDWKMV